MPQPALSLEYREAPQPFPHLPAAYWLLFRLLMSQTHSQSVNPTREHRALDTASALLTRGLFILPQEVMWYLREVRVGTSPGTNQKLATITTRCLSVDRKGFRGARCHSLPVPRREASPRPYPSKRGMTLRKTMRSLAFQKVAGGPAERTFLCLWLVAKIQWLVPAPGLPQQP